MREKLLRDPVHDLIVFDLDDPGERLLLDLIDCPEFQRLRRIRQIGFAFTAFHGAEHSRFTHSIGVVHLARRMLDRLSREQDVAPLARAAVLCAALLHDLGHGPFSHVVEKFFGERHEAWTRRIVLDQGTQIHRALAAFHHRLPDEVVRVLDGAMAPAWLNFLVSSQLDADRFDYLLRDSLMTGVKYGVFDLERLLLMLRISESGDRVYVAAKGLLPVEKYLQSRYQMYRQVYFHKTVTAAEAMMMAALDRAGALLEKTAACPGVVPDSPLDAILRKQRHLSVAEYLAFDDTAMYAALNAWAACNDSVLRDLAGGLLERRLFKSIEIANYEEHDMVVRQRIEAAEEAVRAAGLDPRYYLLYGKSADVAYRPYNPRASECPAGTIWIEDPAEPGTLCDVKDVSPTIRAFTESPYTIWRAFFPARVGVHDLRSTIAAALNG